MAGAWRLNLQRMTNLEFSLVSKVRIPTTVRFTRRTDVRRSLSVRGSVSGIWLTGRVAPCLTTGYSGRNRRESMKCEPQTLI